MKRAILYFYVVFCISVTQLQADLGPIRFAGDSNAIVGTCTITQSGNYRIPNNIIADIFITVSNVSLDLENRELKGVIQIYQDYASIKNGTIRTPEKLTSGVPAILISAGVNNTHIDNCVINPEDHFFTIDGINNNGNQTIITNCVINGSNDIVNPGVGNTAGQNGGNAVINFGNNLVLRHCIIQSGFGGVGGTAAITNAGNSGNGGTGVLVLAGSDIFIENCFIQTGSGAAGSNSSAANDSFAAGNGGSGGIGIDSRSFNTHILNTTVVTANGGNGGSLPGVLVPFPGVAATGASAGNGGTGIVSSADNLFIYKGTVICGSGGNGGTGGRGVPGRTGGIAGTGGSGIVTTAQYTEIIECSITTGTGGTGGAGGTSTITGGNGTAGGAGGVGIQSSGAHAVIISSIISTNPGNSGGAGGAAIVPGTGAVGGIGGVGIDVLGTTTGREIRNCDIVVTGKGGDAGTSGVVAGGEGGHGIRVASTAVGTEVRLCTISNTGGGGLGSGGGANGLDGQAIRDLNPQTLSVAGGSSVIYSNFAYSIANTSQQYLIHGVFNGTQLGTSSPVGAGVSTYDNVYEL